MSNQTDSESRPIYASAGDEVCSYLGRCEDPDNYYSFPTVENCCHSEGRPFPIEPSYQVSTCLGREWPACDRYKAAQNQEDVEPAAAPSRLQTLAQHPQAARAAAIIAAAAILLVVVLFLVLRPQANGPAVASLTPTLAQAAASLTAGPASTQTAIAAATQTANALPTPTGTPTPSPTPTTTPTPSFTPSPTTTPSPTPTRTPFPTTATTPTATPSQTPTPTASATATEAPTATPTPLPAPILLDPPNGQEFEQQAEIRLTWQSIGSLPEDVYYVVTVGYSRLGETWYDDVPWLKDTSWTLSDRSYLLELSDDGLFDWSVQIVQQTGTDADGKPTGIPLSLMSDVWTLRWKAKPEGGGPPQPPPP